MIVTAKYLLNFRAEVAVDGNNLKCISGRPLNLLPLSRE
jgi:hypothetical protein